jgi:hypothetical protein
LAAVDGLTFFYSVCLHSALFERNNPSAGRTVTDKATMVQSDAMLCRIGFQISAANTISAAPRVGLFGWQQTALNQTPYSPIAQVQRFRALGNSHKV